MRRSKANLIFDKGPITSFAVLAEQSDLNPTTVVRELVQNSLDAAKEAERKAVVRFELAKCKQNDIPALDTYKHAFRKARDEAEINRQDSAKNVIKSIERQIEASEIETLFVTDNGIGLVEKGMNALLSEGVSHKSTGGAGSYGYGHTTVIPTSDLRYIFYGGVRKDKKIAAGHTVLASFKESKVIKGKDGYFVIKKMEDMYNPFVYVENEAIPPVIKDKLDMIEKEWGSGSVVIVPSFNHFNNTKKVRSTNIAKERLWKTIQKAVACNFFSAIIEGQLRIEYVYDDSIEELDKDSINQVLDQYKEEKRTAAFLNGHKAYRAYVTMLHGKRHKIQTSLGRVSIVLRESIKEGRTSVGLCRNGMHVTDSIPYLEHHRFGDYAQFHCLILADASDGLFHRLIRKSEPPKHNEIELNRLDEQERERLRECLKGIGNFLRTHLAKLATEEFDITDVLNLKSYGTNALDRLPPRVISGGRGSDGQGGGGSSRGKGGGNGGGTGGSGFKRAGRAVNFSAAPVQTGKRSYAFQVALQENKHANEIRFALDENLDLTCDSSNTEEFVYLSNVKIDDNAASDERLIKSDEGNVLGINLGSGPVRQVKLTFDFALPKESGIDDDTYVSLQAEIVSRKQKMGEKE